MSSRPRLNAFLWIGLLLVLGWLTFVTSEVMKYIEIEEMTMRSVGLPTLAGLAAIFGVVALLYAAVWGGKAMMQWANGGADVVAQPAPLTAEQIAERERTYALEIRAAGLAVDVWHQTSIWNLIKKKNDNFSSIYSQKAEDYPYNRGTRRDNAAINTRASFRHSARDAVAYWPLPTFALGPLKQPKDNGSETNILSGRNAATLGVTLFLWQHADNTTHAQPMIEKLFQFFDEHQDVPEALIISRDGDVTRSGYRIAGTPGVQDGYFVPKVYEAMTGLLVSRSDRVEQYLRPFATNEEEDNQNKRTDMGKLWAFYWKHSVLFDGIYAAKKQAEGVENAYGPGTMSSTYWHAQLPELWQTLSNRGPGHFKPTPWLPVRWAEHQIKEFDAAPMLGYLHRPIKVAMTDETGKKLKPALQVKALQGAWLKALNTLPEGTAPVRVFYDSTDNIDGLIALNNALHGLNTDGTGIELGNVEEGYDLGRRLGNTGVSSALVAINLASMASYLDGGTSAVVYNGSDGSTTVQMVRPPDEATKTQNAKTRWADPFSFGAPGVTQ
ncbi:type VI lipase adapter Tla3 domain-containing protein [Pseudomonas lactis]|nr:DUF2875 family protein [Pseudomonas fluorescens]